uniref:Uncharacterized protein n=1 Tax=Anguilla anguilla TaxID=7936 RepID=A0A0E9SZ26_ANGAN
MGLSFWASIAEMRLRKRVRVWKSFRHQCWFQGRLGHNITLVFMPATAME